MKSHSNDTLTHARGFFLHASAILSSEGVVLFLGHSGSGKSTISSLLADNFEILRDDSVYLLPGENDRWYVNLGFDTKDRHFKTRTGSPVCLEDIASLYPLHTIVRIFGAEYSEVAPLQPMKLCEYLMDAVFEITHQRKSRDIVMEQQWFTKSAQIARKYPGWQLQFTRNATDVLLQFEKMNISVTFIGNSN